MMLETRAVIQRKDPSVETDRCRIVKIIELSNSDFEEFQDNLLVNYDFIAENVDEMWMDENGVDHCLLVIGEENSDGVLVQSEGFSYARYYAFMPNARDYLEREADKMIAHFIGGISPNTDGSVSVHLEDIEEYTGVERGGTTEKFFAEAVARSPLVSEMAQINDAFVLTPAAVHDANIQIELQRKSDILSKTLNTLSEHFSGQELYNMLHECCGMSNEEITDEGFDLEEYFEIEPECSPQITM